MSKRVAVIGAGMTGIRAMKAILEENMESVCFERTSHYGGLWRYHDDHVEGLASVMETTVINHSKEMGLSDFIPPADAPNFMHHREIYKSLSTYMEEWNLFRHVRYNKEVVKVEFADDYRETGRYKVTVKSTQTGDIEMDIFDGVFVCVGHHVYPKWATFPGQEEFKGRIIHTHSLKNADGYHNKNVVIVGIGNSGADAAVEISNVSKQVYLSTRRGAWIVSRLGPRGIPIDLVYHRRWIYTVQQLLPYNWFCWILEQFLNTRFDHSMFNLKPDHRFLAQHPTISDMLPVKLICGAVVIRGNIKKFTEDGVIFDGEKEVTPVDEVVLATGYLVKLPFLGGEITSINDNEVHLYKFMYPPHLPHPSLAIIGMVQNLGSLFTVVESQCRLAAYALSGRTKLPSREEMEADIAAHHSELEKRYVDSSRHRFQTDFVGYLDELNELFGAKPNLLKLFFTDNKLWRALMFGPHLAYQYRLEGPYPWPGARDAILTYRERTVKCLQHYRKFSSRTDSSQSKSAFSVQSILITVFFFLISMFWLVFP